MALWTREAALNLTRVSAARSSITSGALLQRRGLASGGDHHGPAKVDIWKDPTHPGNWKEEQFVVLSLSGWGLLFYGGYKLFTGGKKADKKEEQEAAISQ
ncbi:hypothetical protein M569_04257 [Genlisea aurea]|uniref:Uncharacterized protein n=1 Tax=Genlisea aurea TaxID=192259 RepID=S8E463_9LAMI|nr:hypothetical protein M569_04257 [Genlisea aurea]